MFCGCRCLQRRAKRLASNVLFPSFKRGNNISLHVRPEDSKCRNRRGDCRGPQFHWSENGVERDAVHVEVKSAAYLQSWEQSKLSNIIFSIRPARAWDPETGYRGDLKRQSDVYVFCHYTQKARSKADPLALDDWDFYVISTRKLDEVCGAQKTISLASLQLLGPIRADYSGIKEAIIHCIRGYECTPLHTHHPPTLGILHNFRI